MKMLTFLEHVDVEFYACLINDSFGLLLVAKVVWEYFLNLTVLLPKKGNAIFLIHKIPTPDKRQAVKILITQA